MTPRPLVNKVLVWYSNCKMVKLTLKQLRSEKGLTQAKCAELLQVSLRTYKRYESDESKISSLKHQYLIQRLNEYGRIDEDHGLLTIEQIKNVCNSIFKDYSIEYCYLFGSYAKGKATEKSDVDLLVTMSLDGMKFYKLAETLREKLNKKVDLLDIAQLNNNPTLVQEILKDGIKIYG